MSLVPFFTDDFTIDPGTLGTVHNPQLAPANFETWADPFSDPLVAELGVGAQYNGAFLSSLRSEIDPGVFYATPDGFEAQANVIGPTGNDNRVLFLNFYFSAVVDFVQRATVTLRWRASGSPTNAMRVTYSPEGVTAVNVDFNGPGIDNGIYPRSAFIRIQFTPTALYVYDGATLLKTITADFSYIVELWSLNVTFASITSAPMTGFIVEDLALLTEVADPEPETAVSIGKGYALDMKPTGFGLIELGYHARAVHANPLTDQLYLVLDEVDEPVEPYLPLASTAPSMSASGPIATVYAFDADPDSDMVYQWRGKLNRLPTETAFIYCQVKANDYDNVVLKLYGDDVLLFSQVLTDKAPFTLPLSDAYETFEIELIGTSRVEAVRVAEAIEELEVPG